MIKIILVIFATFNLSNGWNSNVGFYNYSADEVSIEYTYRSDRRVYTESKTIGPWGRYYFQSTNNAQYSLTCAVPEKVFVYGTIFGDQGILPAPQEQLTTTSESEHPIFLTDTLFYKALSTECGYIAERYQDVLYRVSGSIYYDYPDRLDRQLWIGDACPYTGYCDGHPQGSHDDWATVDVNYYTKEARNATQYVEEGGEHTSIWGTIDPDNMILNTSIDLERNAEFLIRLSQYFSMDELDVIIHEKIFEQFTDSQKDALYPYVSLDTGTHLSHHTHMHIHMKRG